LWGLQTSPSRYVITINPNIRADTFMIETATGRVLHLVTYTDLEGDPRVWEIMPRIDSDAEFTA
jgi:hypothetical protein